MVKSRKIPDLVHEMCAPVDIPPSLSPILPNYPFFSNPAASAERISLSNHPSVSIPSSNHSTYLTLDHAKQLMLQEKPLLRKPNSAPDLMKCAKCEKVFQDRDDMEWHQENKYGQEDCIILQKMMLSNYYCKPVI